MLGSDAIAPGDCCSRRAKQAAGTSVCLKDSSVSRIAIARTAPAGPLRSSGARASCRWVWGHSLLAASQERPPAAFDGPGSTGVCVKLTLYRTPVMSATSKLPTSSTTGSGSYFTTTSARPEPRCRLVRRRAGPASFNRTCARAWKRASARVQPRPRDDRCSSNWRVSLHHQRASCPGEAVL